jgi:competence protein ComEC
VSGAWLAPAAAGAFWAGILAADGAGLRGGWAWAALLAGCAMTSAGAVLILRRGPDGKPLLRGAGLLPPVEAEGHRGRVLGAVRGVPAPPGSRSSVAASVLLAVVGMLLLGGGWFAVRDAAVGRSVLARIGGYVRAEGVMSSDPQTGPFGWSARARLERVASDGGAWRLHEPVWLQGRGPPPPVELGDRVRLSGAAGGIPTDDFGDYLRTQGIAATLRVSEIERTAPPFNPLLRAANAVRNALRRAALELWPERRAGLFLGLALGDTSRLDPGLEEDFRATGLGHLLAVSGSNVAMFLGPVLMVAGAARAGRRTRFVVGVGAVAFFALLTRAEPSVLRASVMAGLVLLGVFLGRARSTPAVMGTAILVLLAFDPRLASALGFQLSVAATAGMVAFATPLAERIPGPRALAIAAGATLGAQAAVTPLLLFRFHVVPTVALPANVLAFPAVAPAMLIGLAASGVSLVWPPAGEALAAVANVPMAYLSGVADRMATAPLPSLTSDGGLDAFVMGMAVLAWLAFRVHRARRPRRARDPGRRRGIAAAVVMAVALPALVWGRALRAGPPGSLEVVFFDVGQGDAALVRSPEGAAVLVDAGPEPDQVAAELAAEGVHRLDVAIATHAHADHVAGFPAVLARFPVGLMLEPGCGGDSPSYEDLARALKDEEITPTHPRPGDAYRVADMRIDVLGPPACFHGTESDANNDSIVVRISVGAATVLFTGDVEEPAQLALLEAGVDVRAAVLKVPHHGGGTSMDEFLIEVQAALAVVSVGAGNDYGHPVASVLVTLRSAGAQVVRTDQAGEVVVRFGPGGPYVESPP